ncbi:MAG: hypothetical protein ABR905_11785 [Terracidiphilus sp.]|jgi:hypothetical protein
MTLAGILARLIPEFFMREPQEDSWLATTEEVRRLATPCPICQSKDLTGHLYGEFASQIAAENSDELKEFFHLYSEHRWQQLNQIHRFEGKSNAAIVYAFFCHRFGCMLVVRDPFELYDSSSVLDLVKLNEDEMKTVQSLSMELRSL